MEKLEKKMNDLEILKKSMLIFEKMKDINEKEEKRKKEIEDKLNHKFTKNPQNLKWILIQQMIPLEEMIFLKFLYLLKI